MTDIAATIFIDNGTAEFKAGYAGYLEPSVSFPSVIGRSIHYFNENDYFVGSEVYDQKRLCYTHPIVNGKIDSWDDMTRIWDYCYFKELDVYPTEHPVLISEAPNNSKNNRA